MQAETAPFPARQICRSTQSFINHKGSFMLLIMTCSQDATTDLPLPFLKSIPVFRFNIDLYQNYRWAFNNTGFYIEQNEGTRISARTNAQTFGILFFEHLSGFMWRQPYVCFSVSNLCKGARNASAWIGFVDII